MELIYLLIDELNLAELLVLSASGRKVRDAIINDRRMRAFRGCYRAANLPSITRSPSRNPFLSLFELALNFDLNAHRYALYAIQPCLVQLPLRRLKVGGVMDPVAGVKLRELISDQNFRCKAVEFVRVNFDDEDLIDGQLLIGAFASIFKSVPAISFYLCTFDSGSLLRLFEMVGTSSLTSFTFGSNFIDDFPTPALITAIERNATLLSLEVDGVGLGWDAHLLFALLKSVSASKVTRLTLRDNDIGLVPCSLPPLPQLVYLDLSNNPLSRLEPSAFETWRRSLGCLKTLILD
ncbi:hypothetical protein L0F63_003426 [Massospora cicadina]|nr:hypothetical protein L0F63_003426 [Massospora cicadina]